jgi:hypothetical protein
LHNRNVDARKYQSRGRRQFLERQLRELIAHFDAIVAADDDESPAAARMHVECSPQENASPDGAGTEGHRDHEDSLEYYPFH